MHLHRGLFRVGTGLALFAGLVLPTSPAAAATAPYAPVFFLHDDYPRTPTLVDETLFHQAAHTLSPGGTLSLGFPRSVVLTAARVSADSGTAETVVDRSAHALRVTVTPRQGWEQTTSIEVTGLSDPGSPVGAGLVARTAVTFSATLGTPEASAVMAHSWEYQVEDPLTLLTGARTSVDFAPGFDEVGPLRFDSAELTRHGGGPSYEGFEKVAESGRSASLKLPAAAAPGDAMDLLIRATTTDPESRYAIFRVPSHLLTIRAPEAYEDAAGRIIRRTYYDCLYREPDQAGLVFWTDALHRGAAPAAVADAITSSPEFRSRLVRSAYEQLLHSPSRDEVNAWLPHLAGGMTPTQLDAVFASSPEFFAKYGSTDDAWIRGLYGSLLGRQASGPEVQAWLDVLYANRSRLTIATAFAASPERLNAVVATVYDTLLDRGVDPSGKATWVPFLAGSGRLEQLWAGIVSSPEYAALV